MKDINKNFTVNLWTLQNITKEIVPFTYKLVSKVLEYNKYSNKSLFAMAADILRYELVFRFGGLYVDFKF